MAQLLKELLSTLSIGAGGTSILVIAHKDFTMPSADEIKIAHGFCPAPTYPVMLFELREHKNYAAYNPDISYSKPSGSVLRCNSTTAALGTGYIFRNFTRSWLDGKTVKVRSRADKSDVRMHNYIVVYDGHYDRESLTDFPDGGGMVLKGAGLLQIIADHAGDYGWTEDSAVLDLSAGSETECCLMLFIVDAWSAQWGWFEVDWVKVLGTDGCPIAVEPFDDSVNMEVTGTVHDYGYISSGGP